MEKILFHPVEKIVPPQALWKENIRECKILAGMLQPVETFYPEIADIWVEDMRLSLIHI